MNYTDLLAHWKGELSDPTATGHNWTPAEIEEQALKQIVYGEIVALIEGNVEKMCDIIQYDTEGRELDAFVNGWVERGP